MTDAVILVSLALLAALSLVSLYNLFTAPRLFNISPGESIGSPLVSVLIPARNEERSIQHCLNSVISQSYKNIEILVLDDNSTDHTLQKLEQFGQRENLCVVSGEDLPEGWTGKNWACHQLSLKAKGGLMLFIDADVELKEHALEYAVRLFEKKRLDTLSCFPTQIISTTGEAMVVPLMNWFLLSFLPLDMVLKSSSPALSAANGQFILFSARSYRSIGGHSSHRAERVEDMALIRKIKTSGLRGMTVLGNSAVSCRMYSGFRESFGGFEKNFFPGTGLPAAVFLMLVLLTVISCLPVALWINIFNISAAPSFNTALSFNAASSFLDGPLPALLSALLVLENRISVSLMSRQNILMNIALHPFQMMILLSLGFSSVYKTMTGKITWKGRRL